MPAPLRQYLDAAKPNAYLARNNAGQVLAFLGLWFDNLGLEACTRIAYWIDAPGDIAVRRWVDANLLDTIVPVAKHQGAALIRLRTHEDDEGRQGALAAAGFEHVDDVLTLRAPVPKAMDSFMMQLGMAWTLRFEQAKLKDVLKLHNDAYHDDVDVVRLSPEQLKHMDGTGGEIWRATVAGRPVGFVELSVQTGDDAHKRVGRIDSIAVMPDFRERGIGSELAVWALDRFCKLGVRGALLQVRATNTAALRIYKKIGFDAIARQPIWQMRIKPTPSAVPG